MKGPRVSTSAADHPPPGSTDRASSQVRSERVKLRRGLTFVAMTVVLPGSAQIAAGNKRVGRWALRGWVVLWAVSVLTALLTVVWRGAAVRLLTFAPTLGVVQGTLVVVGIGWGLLLLDAWRISRPPELARRHRLGFAGLNLVLVLTVVGGLVASASIVATQRDLLSAVFAGGGDAKSTNGRYNILLMGGDAGKGRVGMRPDSMTVASVDEDTGRTVLVSLPRNMEDVPFPESSPMHRVFPRGYGCPDHSCLLNAIYTYATEHKSLYPDVSNPGAQATKEAVEGITGLTINYWVLVDMSGFAALVDAVGGITLDIGRRVPVGGGSSKIYGWVEAGANRHLNGHDALWYARSRADSSDYDRIARQKCVMNAMVNQLSPVSVLTNFNKIASAGKQIVATDIPTGDINTLLDLATKAKGQRIGSVALVPPLIYPGNPDFAKARTAVRAKIDAAEAADAKLAAPVDPAKTPPPATPSVDATPKASPKPQRKAGPKPGQDTDDLGEVCSAH